jgi:hypothetical protein
VAISAFVANITTINSVIRAFVAIKNRYKKFVQLVPNEIGGFVANSAFVAKKT